MFIRDNKAITMAHLITHRFKEELDLRLCAQEHAKQIRHTHHGHIVYVFHDGSTMEFKR